MPNPDRPGINDLVEEAIAAVIRGIRAGDHTFEPTGSKSENRSKLEEVWESVGGYFGRGVAGFLEDNTEDVSEWVSDLFGALKDLGTSRYQDMAQITTWALYTERANQEGWSSADLYTDTFCERVFSILGSSDFERDTLSDCKKSYQPDAEEKIDEAYDSFLTGGYGAECQELPEGL